MPGNFQNQGATARNVCVTWAHGDDWLISLVLPLLWGVGECSKNLCLMRSAFPYKADYCGVLMICDARISSGVYSHLMCNKNSP